jgi:hypothetical protein
MKVLAEGTCRVRPLPGPPRGNCTIGRNLSERDEARRDFARLFLAGSYPAMFVLTPGLGEPRELQATDRAARVAIGDFSEEVLSLAEERFKDSLSSVLGEDQGSTPWSSRIAASLSVSGSGVMEFLKMRGLEIAFYQPRFLLFIDRDGSVRIMTYGFVAQHIEEVRGSRPDSKCSPFLMRLTSEDLSQPERDERTIEYWVRRTTCTDSTKALMDDAKALLKAPQGSPRLN